MQHDLLYSRFECQLSTTTIYLKKLTSQINLTCILTNSHFTGAWTRQNSHANSRFSAANFIPVLPGHEALKLNNRALVNQAGIQDKSYYLIWHDRLISYYAN